MIITIDTETHRFGPGNMAPKIVCLSYSIGDSQNKSSGIIGPGSLTPPSVWLGSALDSVLVENSENIIVGHSIAYDFSCALQWWPELTDKIFRAYSFGKIVCTKVREKLLNIRDGAMRQKHSLEELAKDLLDVQLDKDSWRLNYDALENIDLDKWPKGARDYAIKDAETTHALWDHQELRIKNYPAFREEAVRQSAFDFALQLTSVRGIIVDQEYTKDLFRVVDLKKLNCEKTMLAYGLQSPDGSKSTKLIRKFVEQELGNATPKTEKGSVKTDADTLALCSHEGLVAISEYNKFDNIIGTYLATYLAAKDQPIHAQYNVLVKSGRTSSYEPNIQNQPRLDGMRECFVARKGWVFVFCDYDSQELRTLAEACVLLGCGTTLADAYNKDPNFDPHASFAAQLMGITYADAMERKKNGDKEFADRRQQSKAANFGYPGGLGAESFQAYAKGYGLNLSMTEAKKLRDDWLKAWPEMRKYFDHAQHLTRQGVGDVEQLVSGRLRGACSYTEAANTLFQGLAADCSKNALWEVVKKCFSPPGTFALSGCRPIVFIHDEIGIEVPEAYASEAADELAQTMIDAAQEVCRHVPFRATPTLMRRWSKKAKSKKEEGRWTICESF